MKPYYIPKRVNKDNQETMATSGQGSSGQGTTGGNFEINFDPLKFINRMGEYNGSNAAELVQFVTKVEFLINSK